MSPREHPLPSPSDTAPSWVPKDSLKHSITPRIRSHKTDAHAKRPRTRRLRPVGRGGRGGSGSGKGGGEPSRVACSISLRTAPNVSFERANASSWAPLSGGAIVGQMGGWRGGRSLTGGRLCWGRCRCFVLPCSWVYSSSCVGRLRHLV